MSLVSPAANEEPARDWISVAALILVAEGALLWLGACGWLLRRRLDMARTEGDPEL